MLRRWVQTSIHKTAAPRLCRAPSPVTIDPSRAALRLAVVVAVVFSLHVVLQACRFYTPPDLLTETLAQRFDVNGEGTVPAYLSALLLLGCGFVLALIALDTGRRPYHRHWVGLAVVFGLLSFDEATSWHETLIVPVRTVFGAGLSGWFYLAWVIPGGAFVAAFGLTYVGFLRHLPARYRRLFILAGALFVGGALGMELVGRRLASQGIHGMLYTLVYSVEEGLEMTGALTFLYALLSYKAEFGRPVSVRVEAVDAA